MKINNFSSNPFIQLIFAFYENESRSDNHRVKLMSIRLVTKIEGVS